MTKENKNTIKEFLKFINLGGGKLNFINPEHINKRWKMKRFYSQFIRRGDLCFDVGANIGNRTEIFLKLGASVIAVEPQPSCAEQLTKKYGRNKRFTLINKALGGKEGNGEIMAGETHELSSMSKAWLKKIKATGRFSNHKWNKKIKVSITTLDSLIKKYGMPTFCKIDVEGFEYNVLRGLSQPIKAISLEFAPENIEQTMKCINHISKLGKVKFNFSFEESMVLHNPNWVNAKEISEFLYSLPKESWGDIYARCV